VKITILIVFLMIFVKNPVLGGFQMHSPWWKRAKQIIYDYITKYTGVARSDPPQTLGKLGPGLPIFKYRHLFHVLLHITE
jgi:hypothetical protein